MFKSQLKNIIAEILKKFSTTKKLSGPGFEVNFAVQGQDQTQPTPPEIPISNNDEKLPDLRGPAGEAIAALELSFTNKIKESNASDKFKIEALIRALTLETLATECERVWLHIFFSQHMAVQQIVNTVGPTKIKMIYAIFDHYAALYSDEYTQISFELWLHYLTNRNLVRVENELISATDFGRAYIQYVAKANYVLSSRPL